MEKIGTKQKWFHCPYCGAKHSIYDDAANCRGVYLKCTRGCKRTFELVIKDGEQIVRDLSRDIPRTFQRHSADNK